MNCKKCGVVNVEGSTFCMNCGSNLNEVNHTSDFFNVSYISNGQQNNSEIASNSNNEINIDNQSFDMNNNQINSYSNNISTQSFNEVNSGFSNPSLDDNLNINNMSTNEIDASSQSFDMNNNQSIAKMNQLLRPQENNNTSLVNNQINSYSDNISNRSFNEVNSMPNNYSLDNNVVHEQYQQSVKDNINNYSMQTDQFNKKNNNKSILIIVILFVTIISIVATLLLFKKQNNNGSKIGDEVIVKSTFEKDGNNYVLKSETGNLLLDNIKYYYDFCNGYALVENNNNEYGMINGNGKFIVKYGEYSRIDKYSNSCFYKAEDKNYTSSILKYDGSVLYSDENDKFLKNADITTYYSSDKYVLFSSKDKYEYLDNYGKTIIEFKKDDNISKPAIIEGASLDRFLTINYDKKTYIISLSNYKQIIDPLNGKFKINSTSFDYLSLFPDLKIQDKDAVIVIYGWPDESNESVTKTYILKNNKILFELNNCLNAYVNGDQIKCLIQNGGVWEYYDLKGNKINK